MVALWKVAMRFNASTVSLADFHRSYPYVVTSSVDQSVKVWECR